MDIQGYVALNEAFDRVLHMFMLCLVEMKDTPEAC